jgi:Flp pilus assembly pilin Flp
LQQTPNNIVRPAPAPALARRPRGRPRFAVPGRRRKALGEESGAALVEFALILPFVMLIVVVFLDFGRAINYWIDTTHLASEGARLAAVDRVPTGSGSLQAYIRSKADTPELKDGGSGSIADPLQVCVNPDGEDVGDPVEVEVKTSYRWIPLLGLDAVQTQIGGRATMRRERVPENVSSGCE